MANLRLERNVEIGVLLAKCRINSYDESLRTQEALAKHLNRPKKKICEVENGHSPITLDLAARWCLATRHYEAWKIIESMFGLEIMATPPIHPEYTLCMMGAISNLKKQMRDAQMATEEIEHIWNERRPGKKVDWRKFVPHAQQIYDVLKAAETALYALERECGLNLHEVARIWTQEQHSKEIVVGDAVL